MARVRRAASAALVLLLAAAAIAAGAAPARPALVPAADVAASLGTLVAWPPSAGLLVAEVVTGGATASDEYAELTNAGPATVDLAGLELVYVTASGSTVTRKASWAVATPLEPGRHVLVANASGSFAGIADGTYSGGFAATGGALVLRPTGGTPIDAVAWGDATNAFVEGSAAPAPPAGSSLERRPGGPGGNTVDTNDNLVDFALNAAPVAQNHAALPIPGPSPTPSSTATPTPASPSPTSTSTTQPTPSTTPTAEPTRTPTPTPTPDPPATPTPEPTSESTPTPEPTPEPTPTATPELTPTAAPTVEPSTTAGPTTEPSTTPAPAPIPIAAARALADGSQVMVEGVVTLPLGALEAGRGGFVQDGSAGIAVYLGSAPSSPVAPGTVVRLTGTVDDRYAERTLRVALSDVVVVGAGARPDAVPVGTGAAGEAVEGAEVAVTGTIVEAPAAFADGLGILVDDGSGAIRAIVGPGALAAIVPARGDLVRVLGPLGQRDSSGTGTAGYRVYAMIAGDLEVLPPVPTPTDSPAPEPSATTGPSASPTADASLSPSSTPATGPSPTPIATATRVPTPTATPAPTTPPTTSFPAIAGLRALPLGTLVTAAGTVTAEAGRLGGPTLTVIQDETAAIVVRLWAGAAAPARGTRIVVTGRLAAPYGQLEIRPALGGIAPAPDPASAPAPVVLVAGAIGEAEEARLVTVVGTVERTLALRPSGGLVASLVDEAGDRVRVQADGSSGLTRTALTAGRRYRLTGVVGQHASGRGRLDGYRVWLRDRLDIVDVAATGPRPTPSPSPTGGAGDPAAIPIAQALLRPGVPVAVEGVVTVPPTFLDGTRRRIIIQDVSAAVEVRLPADVAAPSPGRRLRVFGDVGRAYGAPRIGATRVVDLGPAALPAPIEISASPGAASEWRLVRVSGTVVDVHRLGDRWRAELAVGAGRVAVVGLAGAGISSTALREGRRATVVGIVRRPYPGSADRRFAVEPRSPSDIALGAAQTGSGTRTGSGSGTGSGGGRSDPADERGGRTTSAAPTVDLADLAGHLGSLVRVGGLVATLEPAGFVLDDGTASGHVELRSEAAAFLGLVEPGDAIELTGRVGDGVGGPTLVVETAADLVRLGDPGTAASSPDPAALGDPSSELATASAAPGSALSGAPAGDGSGPRQAGFGALPGLAPVGPASLLFVGLATGAVTLGRRWRARRRHARRVADRLAALLAPAEPAG